MATVGIKINGNGPSSGTLHALTKIRIEQIARMRINGVRDEKICELLNISSPVLKFITAKQEYKDTEEAILCGWTTKADEAMAGNIEELKRTMRTAVPAAMRCVLDAVNQRRDLSTALKAAGEIFDRDPDGAFIKRNKAENSSIVLNVPSVVFDNAVKDANSVTKELELEKK